MINSVTNWPTVSCGCSKLYCRSGETRKSGGAERSGERGLQENDGAEREAAPRSRSGNGAGSGSYTNRPERGAAFCAYGPLTCSDGYVLLARCYLP